MSYSEASGLGPGELRALVENLVDQVLGEKMNSRLSSWANSPATQLTSRVFDDSSPVQSGDSRTLGRLGEMGGIIRGINDYNAIQAQRAFAKPGSTTAEIDLPKNFWRGAPSVLSGISGIGSAYESGDPIGGGLAGLQAGNALSASGLAGPQAGLIGLGIGLLAGILGGHHRVDRWNRPKFTDAKKAVNKWFTMDRGEEDLYYMPESFYFHGGMTGARHLVVHIGNNQFDDHIRDALTNEYSSQLQRGLAF